MLPSHLLTSYRQSASALSATSDNTSRSARPSFCEDAVSEDWLSRPLLPHFATRNPTPAQRRRSSSHTGEPPGLFATLLFDRGKAYDHDAKSPAPEAAVSDQRRTPRIGSQRHSHSRDAASRTTRKMPQCNQGPAIVACRDSSRWPYSEKSEFPETGMSLVSHLESKAPPKVSKRWAKTPKKVTTKKKKKMAEVTSKKRPVQDDEELDQRPAKVAKVEAKANIKKKVGNSSANTISETPLLEVIYISDSEDEKPNLRNEDRPAYLPLPPSAHNSRGSLQLELFRPPTDENDRQSWIKVDSPDNIPNFSSELISLPNDNSKAAEELHKLRQELQTEREKSKNLQQELEERETSLKQNNKAVSEREQPLQSQLDAERQATRVATKECEHLREHLRCCQENLATQKKVETERQVQLAEHEQQKSALEQENECLHDNVRRLNTEAKELRNQMSSLQDDKTVLSTELETSKTTSSPSFRHIPALSPVPSLCSSSTTASTEEEIKTDNVRKRYLKVNRELTILQAIARNMVTCTRSMDLSSFGDFGKYANQLRKVLEDEGSPQILPRSLSSFVGKADDEDDGGSQRSGG